MKLHTKLALGVISTLFAVSIAVAAGYDAKMSQHTHSKRCNSMNPLSGEMGMDSAARATKHLRELKARLNLTNDQQPAWQTFSDQVNDQAKSMASMRDKMRGKAQNVPMTLPMSTPEQMAKMAEMMKDRAQDMAKMADIVKTFYATLTPEQQAAFDKMHISHMGSMSHKIRTSQM